ncbi:phage minor capsid protein [Streptomyces sp. CHA1]|uniref:phage minor capsid protein n=1 Tax=Streptomyces TaxID=1883 RepID=UPI001BFC02CD|nr:MULTISPECIES: phage minor capsid protein [unclassified Streptomyces]MBT3157358.1 phage capsid protein [Streptomyces sp. G11C]MCO6700317.1 phage minor capsid protein [Streptomyces sp. CHB9.2]MCO6706453.1 phage minor capsid protein [Streptomyces sp. CHA3]MCO6712195.1 phage minor capsid protein [Streptomyces sp. CHB19.2]MCO6718629.1 phage minor capsid protein [Streptomyces sp. Vc714c-19]
MVEPLAERTRDLYAGAEERLLGIIARQLAAGLEAPGWVEAKLAAVQQVRRASQAVVDELGKAVSLDVFDAVAEAYNVGHRAAVAELGALSEDAGRLVDDRLPQAQAVDRLAQEAVDVVTATHRSILRAVVDTFRAVVSSVAATPLLGTGTRRQATQDALRQFADAGIRAFVDQAGRRWSLPSYAEMAVRTATARAATEAHTRTLTEHGVDLVVVSNSPRECPLCRPWERTVLTIGGPAGPRTVEVEHAVEDGRTVRVRVAGSLDEARAAGLQHPNCRHSVSAYTPGLTEVDDAEPDPAGYEAGQRQRAIERNIRKWKRRQAVALDPQEQRAAAGKVRQWQGAMRQHLTAHPDLRRLRHREQPGAGNLPERRREATPEDMERARVWSGDDRAVREMDDDQLAAALRTPLDDRARRRIEDEVDRRDTEALLDRAAPGGHLVDDLLGLSDDDLARVWSHVDDRDRVRIMAETDRRDRAGRLPDVRPDLVGLSDDQLAARYRNAGHGPEAEAIAAEAARRDLLGRLFPGGHLADDLADVGDSELAWAMQYADEAELLRIAGEMDRRDAVELPPPAATGNAVDDLLADRDGLAEAMGERTPDPDAWGALDGVAPEADAGFWDDLKRAAGRLFRDDDEDQDERHRITRREARALYDEYVYRQYLAAEDACRGYLLSKKAHAAGVDPLSLFSGPARVAYSRASDELKEWWAEHGRLTQAEFIEQVTGKAQRWAESARKSESDQQNKR